MKMIDVTNSHSSLVQNQLENTDAQFIQVFSLGNTTVVYTKTTTHVEIVIRNKARNIQDAEVEYVLNYFNRKYGYSSTLNDWEVFKLKGFVELNISL